MKRPAFRGFTAAGVLVLAVAAGAAGGAVAYSAGQGSGAGTPPAVTTLHPVADEATAEPTPSAAAAVDENPAPAVEVVRPGQASMKVLAPVAPAGSSGETAQEAADRAAAEADRADDAADRAGKFTAPAPEPKVGASPAPATQEEDPVAATPECTSSQIRPATPATRADPWTVTYGCQGGKWVESSRTKVVFPPESVPPPPPGS